MKTAIIYYSFEGDTKYLADELSKKTNADLIALKPVKELQSKGFSKFVWGGMQAVMKKKPELEKYDFKPEKYDLIIFAAPVWAGTFAPPISTFLSKENVKDKKVTYFYCHQGGPGKTDLKFKEALVNSDIISGLDLNTKKDSREDNFKKLLVWYNNIK